MADEATDNNGTEELSAAPPPEEDYKEVLAEDHSMQEERDNDDAAAAEVFAGYSLQSAGIRFRGPRSGKVQGEHISIMLCAYHMLCEHVAYLINKPTRAFSKTIISNII